MFAISWLVLCAAVAASQAHATTFTVTNNDDSGNGSLRQAIINANAFPGPDEIQFRIPRTGLQTIAPATDLPEITESLEIRGFSQPGSAANTDPRGNNAVYGIELRGPGSGGDGLRVTGLALGSTIEGLVINGWSGSDSSAGIHMVDGFLSVEDCFIGTDAAALQRVPNTIGVLFDGGFGFIEGRTVISGNTLDGVRCISAQYAAVDAFIGVTASGLQPLGNGADGVSLVDSGFVIGGSIGGNRGSGVRIHGGGGAVAGYIGTDETGTRPLGNAGPGIIVEDEDGSSNVLIAGAIVAFNEGAGIAVAGGSIGTGIFPAGSYGNMGLNIDLGNDGPTANDTCDSDMGPNKVQNKPVLTGVTNVSGVLHVQGKLETEGISDPRDRGKTYEIFYYTSPSCDQANPSIKRQTLDATFIQDQADCLTIFDTPLFSFLGGGPQDGDRFLVATASETWPVLGGTSEISNCIPLPGTAGVDLQLEVTASPDPAKEGVPLVYTLSVTNDGTLVATEVRVTDTLPEGLEFHSADPGCTFRAGTVTCDFGAVSGNGGLATRSFSVIPSQLGEVTNCAAVTSLEDDGDVSDNSFCSVTVVESAPQDLAGQSNAQPFVCKNLKNPTRRQCTLGRLGQKVTFLNNGKPWFTGSFSMTSSCTKPGTLRESCTLNGKLTLGTYDALAVPPNTLALYVSSDDVIDAGDTLAMSIPTSSLKRTASHDSVVIKYTHPKGRSLAGRRVLLGLDSLDEVFETNEDNNTLVIGSLQ